MTTLRVVVLAIILTLGLPSPAAPTGSELLLSFTDGDTRLIRGALLFQAHAGLALDAGDIVETAADHTAQIEFGERFTAGLGPATRVMVSRQGAAGPLRLAVLAGWVKVQRLQPGGALTLEAPVLRSAIGTSSDVLHVDGEHGELFAETAALRLTLVAASGRPGQTVEVGREQLADCQRGECKIVPRPTPAFLGGLPRVFRDPLLSLRGRSRPSEAGAGTPVRYEDIEAWLDARTDLRAGFTQRFQQRLRDAGFRARLERNLARHPEWGPILHPPPPRSPSGSTKPS